MTHEGDHRPTYIRAAVGPYRDTSDEELRERIRTLRTNINTRYSSLHERQEGDDDPTYSMRQAVVMFFLGAIYLCTYDSSNLLRSWPTYYLLFFSFAAGIGSIILKQRQANAAHLRQRLKRYKNFINARLVKAFLISWFSLVLCVTTPSYLCLLFTAFVAVSQFFSSFDLKRYITASHDLHELDEIEQLREDLYNLEGELRKAEGTILETQPASNREVSDLVRVQNG
ncbi:hypothetical protein KBD61_05440 [Patescibacteria group bacterium]|nr:hypothetical protein [Patescibacteria group bacterium]MBP9710434.1 hypothetical protein [Patescibacteria group bacterium]